MRLPHWRSFLPASMVTPNYVPPSAQEQRFHLCAAVTNFSSTAVIQRIKDAACSTTHTRYQAAT